MCSKSWLAISSYLQLRNRHPIPIRCIKMTNPNLTFFLPVSKEMIMSAPQTSIPNRTLLSTYLPSSNKQTNKKKPVVFPTIGATRYFLVYMKHWSSITSFLVFLRAPDTNCLSSLPITCCLNQDPPLLWPTAGKHGLIASLPC